MPIVIDEGPDCQLFPEITSPKKRRFLAAFAQCGGILMSGQLSGIDHRNHYNWLRADERYAECFEKAKQIAGDSWEDEVTRRGFHGYDKPVIYEGKITGTYKAYSDTLAMFMLNGTRPEKFKTRATEPEGDHRPITVQFIQFNVNHNSPSLPAEEISAAVLAGDGNGHQAGRESLAPPERQGQNGLKFHNFKDVSGE